MTISKRDALEKIQSNEKILSQSEIEDTLLEDQINLLHSLRRQIQEEIKEDGDNVTDSSSFDGLLNGIINSKNIMNLILLEEFVNFLGLKSFGIIGPALVSIPATHIDDFLNAISQYLEIYYTEINDNNIENPFPLANANLQTALTNELNNFTQEHIPLVNVYARFASTVGEEEVTICQTSELITHLPLETKNESPVQINAVIQDDGVAPKSLAPKTNPVKIHQINEPITYVPNQNGDSRIPVTSRMPVNAAYFSQPQAFFAHAPLQPQASFAHAPLQPLPSPNSNGLQENLSDAYIQSQKKFHFN